MAHQIPLFERLTPSTPFQGGRLTDTDVLTLGDAARMASEHSGESVTVGDFLRAAARGEITMHAVCPRDVTMEPCREGDMPMPRCAGAADGRPPLGCGNQRAGWQAARRASRFSGAHPLRWWRGFPGARLPRRAARTASLAGQVMTKPNAPAAVARARVRDAIERATHRLVRSPRPKPLHRRQTVPRPTWTAWGVQCLGGAQGMTNRSLTWGKFPTV